MNEVHLVHKSAKVGASEATLLNMLNISPFTYGMVVQYVYDSGNVFPPNILDIEEDTLLSYFTAAVRNVTCVSLAAGYPTIVSVSHSLVNSYKNLLAISLGTDYDFEGSEKVFLPSHISQIIIPWMIPFTAFFPTYGTEDANYHSNFLLRKIFNLRCVEHQFAIWVVH